MTGLLFFAFIFGSIVGSFLNVVGLRFLKEESIIWPASHCYHCHQNIKPYDNVPILSWLWLRGKCRSCKHRISIQYPLIELLTGLLFTLTVYQFGVTWQTLLLLYLIGNLIVILITDMKEQYIFDINSLGLIPAGLIYTYFNLGHVSGTTIIPLGPYSWTLPMIFVSALVSILGAFVIFFSLNLLSKLMVGKAGFGEGDTRLLMGIGAFVGLKYMLITFILSFLLQVLVGIPMLVIQWIRNKAYKAMLAMGLGFFTAMLPYFLQTWIQESTLVLVLTLVCGVLAMTFAIKAIRLAKDLPTGLTYLPFGPAIVVAALFVIFLQEKILF